LIIILDEVNEMLSSKVAGLRRTASLAIILALFSILFIQFAGANEGYLNISGTKFLDLDSNGIKTPSEPGLANYIIYFDKNNNTRWDSGETYVQTLENGEYRFTKLSNKTHKNSFIIRELVSSGDKFRPSSPRSGYYSVNLTDNKVTNATGIDFGNSISIASEEKKDNTISLIWWLIAIALIVIGAIALIIGWLMLKSLDKAQNKGEKEKSADKRTEIHVLVALGLILLFLGFYLLITLLQLSRDLTSVETVMMWNSFALITPVFLALLVFGAVLLMLYVQKILKQRDETGGMRKTIAGLLVAGLIAVVLFSLSGTINSENQNIITQYIQLVGIVIAFYFGSRATEDAYKGSKGGEGNAQDDLEVKKVTYDPQNKEIMIKVSNSKGRSFGVNTVKIEDEKSVLASGPAVAFGSESFKEIDIRLKLTKEQMDKLDKIKEDKEYNITIETTPIGSKNCKSKIDKVVDMAAEPPAEPSKPPAESSKPPAIPTESSAGASFKNFLAKKNLSSGKKSVAAGDIIEREDFPTMIDSWQKEGSIEAVVKFRPKREFRDGDDLMVPNATDANQFPASKLNTWKKQGWIEGVELQENGSLKVTWQSP
jgi:heme/copper-type cytochrome/quinol oxidase subunit 2